MATEEVLKGVTAERPEGVQTYRIQLKNNNGENIKVELNEHQLEALIDTSQDALGEADIGKRTNNTYFTARIDEVISHE